MIKIVNIIGARPQFIKLAPISRAIKEFNKRCGQRGLRVKEVLLHTGQHYDYNMNDIFFQDLNIQRPDYCLNVGSHNHGKQTGLMLEGIECVLKKEKPDIVLVYGDTNSTLSGALAAKKLYMTLVHVEAGLRSYNMSMPEEINRVVVDRISDILFCPSKLAVSNLLLEGIKNCAAKLYPKVIITGDVMYDAVLFYLDIANKRSDVLKRLCLRAKDYYLATIHRAENTDNPQRLKQILNSLGDIARRRLPVVFPVHPRTKNAINTFGIKDCTNLIKMIDPVSYLDMLMLEKNAKAILTDSGGVQKEAYFLKVPCLTLRNETEWIETLNSNCNILTGPDKKKINTALDMFSRSHLRYRKLYGDGAASEKIVKAIVSIGLHKKSFSP